MQFVWYVHVKAISYAVCMDCSCEGYLLCSLYGMFIWKLSPMQFVWIVHVKTISYAVCMDCSCEGYLLCSLYGMFM